MSKLFHLDRSLDPVPRDVQTSLAVHRTHAINGSRRAQLQRTLRSRDSQARLARQKVAPIWLYNLECTAQDKPMLTSKLLTPYAIER